MHDAWFFIGIFVFIFIVWIAIGGPFHPLSFSGPTLALPGELGGGTYLSLPRAPFKIGGSDVSLPGSSSGGSPDNPGNYNYFNSYVPGGVFGTPSGYRGTMLLNQYISGAGSSDPNGESIRLSASSGARAPVNITGWKLVSEATGSSATIPKGSSLPANGIINAIEDIELAPGTQALILSGQSPIGASFRENKCIGYFSAYQKFTPPLPQNCPAPADELKAFYGADYIRDPACINYVDTLSRCQPTLSPPVSLSGSCQRFLIKYLNYNGCVDAHKNDADFRGDTWRIYLGRTAPMWRTRREAVKLLDAQGNTVSAFSY